MSDEAPPLRIRRTCDDIWEVQVRGGAALAPVDISGPVRIGGPAMTLALGPDGMSDVHHPLEYAPVALIGGGAGTWLNIATNRGDDDGWDIHRSMFHVFDVEFSNLGDIEIEGLELREDGTTVRALWVVRPYEKDEDEDTSAN